MHKLLKAETSALLKWRAIIYTIAIIVILGAFSPFLNIMNEDPTLGGCFEFTYIVLMITSTILGLFMYRDYSQNTIRNKIVVGHSRASVYFSKSITISGFMLLVIIMFFALSVSIGACFGDIGYIDWNIFVQNCLMVLISTLAIASLVALTSICIQSPIGAMLPLMLMMTAMFVCMIMLEMFMVNENTAMIELFQTMPILSLITLTETTKPFDLIGTAVYGAVLICVLQIGGYTIFRKMDLK